MNRNVYLIRSTSLANEVYYKIGFTKQLLADRLKQLQTGNPNKLDVICTYSSAYATQLEAILHRTYKTNNVQLEWFELSDDEVEMFLVYCVKFDRNLELLSHNSYWNKSYIQDDLSDIDLEYPTNNPIKEDDDELWYM